jgi:hypothetical protein
LIIGLIVLGLLLIGFFGLRAMRSYIRLQQMGLQPGVTEVEMVRGWMTIPYIAKAYRVPEAYLFEQLDIPPEGNHRKSLAQLNREYAPGERGVMIDRVKAALRLYQAEHPIPPPERGHD